MEIMVFIQSEKKEGPNEDGNDKKLKQSVSIALREASIKLSLKVVSTTFLLVCFVCLKESTCETRKNVFYFTLKALFILEIIKF